MSPSSNKPTVVVIGAGIIGLTIALRILESIERLFADPATRPEVLIVASEWPAAIPGAPSTHSVNYASMWAGAHVRPIIGTNDQLRREARWLKDTVAVFDRQVEDEPWLGISRFPGVEFFETPVRDYDLIDSEGFKNETGLRGFRKLSPAELPDGVQIGIEYETYCLNPPIYCSALLRRFLLKGGKTVHRVLVNEWESFGLRPNVKFVVNASGTGFADPKCFPTRGQTVVTTLTEITKTVTRQSKDGSWSFIIPRPLEGGAIVGGTKEPGVWDVNARPETRESLLRNGKQIRPYAQEQTPGNKADLGDDVGVIADIVGRRPTRDGGMRLEVEKRRLVRNHLDKKLTGETESVVIHAYGVGGRGYEMSWGIAEEVVGIAGDLLRPVQRTLSKL